MSVFFNTFLSPKLFSYFNLLSLAFPFLMALHCLLLGFWIIQFKKRAVIFILGTVFFVLPTLRWVNYHPVQSQSADLKVITFNNKSKKNAQDYLNAQKADLVFLQESGTKGASMPELDLKYQTDQEWLLSIYSRYKILKQGTFMEDKERIGKAQYADILVKGKIIRCINVYLEPYFFVKNKIMPSQDMDQNEIKGKIVLSTLLKTFKIHAEQVSEIKEFIAKSPYPVILCGDFNSVPNSYEYYQLSKGLSDAFVLSGSGWATSFHDYKIPIRIDYILSSSQIKALTYQVDRSVNISDHFPVIAEFKILNE